MRGLSIGWLLRKGMSESSSRRVYYRPGEEVPYYGTYEAGVERREGGETTMRRAQEQVGQVADQARQTVGSVSGQVSHYGDEMQRQVQAHGR
ncbi:MAG: hypothetical protein KatS3mg057_1550 [Herpetosiphonaceae bacterium]|nr:MAG: hypothetical protein KatS3mg057_1550 [Herpetosiphonaceae bacterium]